MEEIDPATASDTDLAGVWAVGVAVEREALPGEPTPPLEHALASYRRAPDYRRRRWWLSRRDGDIVGFAHASSDDLPDRRASAHVDVEVVPAARQGGIGSALLRQTVDAATDWGCSILDLSARVGGPGDRFLAAAGGELRLVERRSACRTAELDRSLLEGWVRRARERAARYSLVTWDGPCPDPLLRSFAALDEGRMIPEALRAFEQARISQDQEWWTIAARHDDSGELVGFTEVVFPTLWPENAYQEDTRVLPEHRDRGLGRWLKAAMALRILDERPAVARIEAWNAGGSEAMLGINRAMGFQVLENWGVWHVPLEDSLLSR